MTEGHRIWAHAKREQPCDMPVYRQGEKGATCKRRARYIVHTPWDNSTYAYCWQHAPKYERGRDKLLTVEGVQ